MNRTLLERRWFQLVTLLLASAVVCALASRRPKLDDDALGRVAARVRIGMSRDEVVALIRTCRPNNARDLATSSWHGEKRDGREFRMLWDWDVNLPPADQVAWVELDIDDDRGRELFILLGPDGKVTGLRLESDSSWEEWRYALSCGTGWDWFPIIAERQCDRTGGDLRDLWDSLTD